MKKLAILLGAVLVSGTLLAQKASSDDSKYSLEGMINYNSTTGISWDATSVRMRYFMDDNNVVRLSVGMNLNKIEDEVSGFNLGLGYERHLNGTDKLSPYLGGGFSMLATNLNDEKTNDFGLNALAGMDYYVFENVYLGLELGLSFAVNDDRGLYNSMTSAVRCGWRF
jgi:opacity protein-like surface antigen